MKQIIVKCPCCQKPVLWNESSRHRPFCSRRCKLIDLGEWAQERYSVASEEEELSSEWQATGEGSHK